MLPVEEFVEDLNQSSALGGLLPLRNSAQSFDRFTSLVNRLAIFVAKRRERKRRFGWWADPRSTSG